MAKTASSRKTQLVIDKIYDNRVAKQIGIVLAGSAGQKIKSAATLFARAAMLAGLYATQKDDYPITVQTGHSLSEIILSSQPVVYTAIDSPDYFLLISEEGLKASTERWLKLEQTCTAFVDSAIDLPETKARIHTLAFRSVSEPIGKKVVSIVALSAFLKYSGLFPMKAFSEAVERFQDKTIRDPNFQALAAGETLVRKIRDKS